MNTLTMNTHLTRNPDLIATDMDGDTVMMCIERGEYYGLGGVGSRVWELLTQPISITEITRIICAEYDIDELTCQSDMQAFVEEMIQNGLVSAA